MQKKNFLIILLVALNSVSSFAASRTAGKANDHNPLTFSTKFNCKPSEVAKLYGKKFVILDNNLDVCSWEYAGKHGFQNPKKAVYQDLSDKAGWPDIHVKSGTVAIDPIAGRFKFAEGNTDTKLKRLKFTMTPHGIARLPVIKNSILFCPNGETWSGLRIVDISNPQKIKTITTFAVGCFGKDATSFGNRLYTHANYYGTTIFDISNPEKIKKLAHWSLAPPANHGTKVIPFAQNKKQYFYCYVRPEGNWKDWPDKPIVPKAGLRLVDVTDPKHIITKNLNLNFQFLAVKGNYAYRKVKNQTEIYSIKNPAKPRKTGLLNAVYLNSNRNYLYGKKKNSLLIFNNQNPEKPVEITVIAGIKKTPNIAINGNYAYLISNGNLLLTLDISSVKNSKIVNTIKLAKMKSCAGVTIGNNGKTCIVTDGKSGFGYALFDLSNPAAPKAAGRYYASGEIQHLLVSGNKATASLEWGGVQTLLDVTNPLAIKITGYYHSGMFDNYADTFRGNYLYFGKNQKDTVIDVSDPANPKEVGIYQPEEKPLFPVRFWNQTGFTIGRLKGNIVLTSYDYRNPKAPKKIGRCILGKDLLHSLTTNGKLLVAVGKSSLITVNVKDPATPTVLGKLLDKTIDSHGYYNWQGSGRRIGLRQGYVYGIRGSERADDPRIAVYDVRNPAKPNFIYQSPESKPAFQEDWFDNRLLHQGDMFNDLIIDGRYMYVCDYWGGVRVYDLKNPVKPVCVDFEFTPYFALMPESWSRKEYKKAIKSGDMHKYFGLTPGKWAKRLKIGKKLAWTKMIYSPGYELFAWNIGELIGDYLCQPKLGGIAVYKIKRSPETPFGKVTIRFK